ncbi:transcription factor Pcc1-domain-containing protein [Xylariales sp. PMI_506]|nr:transcription factor Pcc1-domain-containing protein [Xylariales sp. PMI_506]
MAAKAAPQEFPCSLTLDVPFPTARLASIAQRSLQVDKELSPLVRRAFSITSPIDNDGIQHATDTVLRVEYSATTNRMLRVAVNSFMESLALVIEVMEHLDTDVLATQVS